MNRKLILLMAFSLFGFLSCKGFTNLPVDAFEKMRAEDASTLLLDVRTAEEFAEGHLPGAIHLDWFGSGFLESAQKMLDPACPVMVYCRSGKRSAAASAKLARSGFQVYNLEGGYLAWKEAGKPVTLYEVERFCTHSGVPVEMTLIKHGSLALSYKGLSIQVDPVAGYGRPTDYAAEFPRADIILVTHEHPDHLDDATLADLTGESTRLLLNAKSAGIIGRGEVIGNGESRELPEGILLEAVPAYNTTPGREKFHPRGNGNGYVLSIDGLRIYIAGDTEDVPEIADLRDIDVALLPVNQPYTMTVEQCIKAAETIRPKVLIPYHFSQTDLSGLEEALPGMDVRMRQMQ